MAVSRIKRVIHGWAWNTFAVGMSMSAVCLALASLEYQPRWLRIIEYVFYGMNIVTFALNTIMLTLQAFIFPNQAKRLILDGNKGMFVPLVALSFATIIIGAVTLEVHKPWGSPNSLIGVFWFYVAFALLISFFMIVIWFQRPHSISDFTPAAMFLFFPIMLTGVVGFNVLGAIDAEDPRTVPILVASYLCQGAGTGVTFLFLALYLLRIVTTGFMKGHQANGAFVACGPPGFTALALMKLAEYAKDILEENDYFEEEAGDAWYVVSTMAAIMLLGLAIALCLMAALPYASKVHWALRDSLSAAALTFPNIGHMTALRTLATILDSKGLGIVPILEVIVLCGVWTNLACFIVVAFAKGRILTSSEEDVIREEMGLEPKPQDHHHGGGSHSHQAHIQEPSTLPELHGSHHHTEEKHPLSSADSSPPGTPMRTRQYHQV